MHRNLPRSPMECADPTRSTPGRGLLAAIGVGVCLVLVNLTWPSAGIGEASYLGVAIGASAGAWLGWHRRRGLVPALIAVGISLSAAGDVVYGIFMWTGGAVPDTSVADVGWLGAYVAISAALLRVLRGSRERIDLDGWIDIVAVMVVAMLLQWQFAIANVVADSQTPVTVRLVWALYPALDSVLIALVVRALLAGQLGRSASALLASGAGCWFVADFGYTVLAPSDGFATWLNAGWLLGAILLAAATWFPESLAGRGADHAAPRALRIGPGRIAVALVPMLLPGGLEIVEWTQGDDTNPVPLFVAMVVLVGLAFLRAVRLSAIGQRHQARLRSQERLAHAMAANGSDASFVINVDGTIRTDAGQLADIVGLPHLDTIGTDVFQLVVPVDFDAALLAFDTLIGDPGRAVQGELKVRHHEGHEVWLDIRCVNLVDDPDVNGVLVNVHDVTERRAAQDQLAHMAFHDGLTGLPNRALFADRAHQALRRNVRNGTDPAVIFLDLDGFKVINDSLGHTAGDELLREVGRRLVDTVRPSDTVARLGGDEFAILLEESARPVDQATTISDRILAILATPIDVGDQKVVVSASLGIAVGTPEATGSSLLRDADVAMYRAKSGGKGRWVVHDSDMRAAAVERLQLETDLLGALDAGQLLLMYQPVVELETEAVVGFEALLRWQHPTLGLIAPDRFIPLAEENGLIVPIGAWVLREACRTAARWGVEHPQHDGLTMSVNVSARQIGSPDLLVHVAEALAESGLQPSRLVLEMTETTLVQDAAMAAVRLTELRELGVRLAIDDFGTGYSSLSYLRQFPVDILKIDRSFINSINDPAQVPAIVRGLLDLGRTLELATVAEGVELDIQRDYLRDEHCEYAQGYLFARPLDTAAAEHLLSTLQPRGSRSNHEVTHVD